MIDRVRMFLSAGLAAAALQATAAQAQVFTPTYMAPRPASDVGIYLADGPGEFAVEGIWRRSYGGYDLGLRGGLADTPDVSILIGGEFRNPISADAPVDLAFTGHAQGLLSDDGSGAGFLAGLSIGHTFASSDLSFTPYLHPRAGLVTGFGDDDLDLELLADFGFDLRFSPSMELRFALAFEDRGADWGVGFAWR
jgi:hypothetical protein